MDCQMDWLQSCLNPSALSLWAVENKGNQCALKYSATDRHWGTSSNTTAYHSTRDSEYTRKRHQGEVLSRNWQTFSIKKLRTHIHRKDTSQKVLVRSLEYLGRLSRDSPPCMKSNCKDCKKWQILQMLKTNRR